MLALFVEDNNIGQGEVKHIYEKWGNLPEKQRESGTIDFDMFCDMLEIEPTGEYHKLFTVRESSPHCRRIGENVIVAGVAQYTIRLGRLRRR